MTPLILKNKFSFRLGAPSYIFPADVLPNARKLADFVDDIEIVLFESDAIAPLPDPRVVSELGALAAEKALSYSVHLPLDADPGSRDEDERKAALGRILRGISRLAPLHPRAYILHFPAPPDSSRTSCRADWLAALGRSAAELRGAGINPATLCVENLDYPFERVADFVEKAGFSVCLDVGHALLYGHALGPLLERHPERIRVVHLHGVANGRAHRPAGTMPPETLRMLREFLERPGAPSRVLTLEVFSEPFLTQSLETIEKWTNR